MRDSKTPLSEEAADEAQVKSYIKVLVLAMVIGLVFMGVVGTWAWETYGSKLADAPPLPSGTPPLSSKPATSR